MAKAKLFLFAALAACAVPATASVITYGSSSARMCFEAADSPLTPSRSDLENCNLAFTEALPRDDVVATYVNRGILLSRRGQTERAIADFDAAIAIDPDQAEAYLNKAAAVFRLNDAQEAARLFAIALDKNTKRPEQAYYGLGVVNEALGNIPAAYRSFRRANELAPEWAEPRVELRRFRAVSSN